MLSVNSDSFTSFPIQIYFIYFSSLIAMTRTSKTILNVSGESGHLLLLLILEEMVSVFTTENDVCYGLSYLIFIRLRYVPPMPTFWRVFILNGCWILLKAFSAFIEMIIRFLFFSLLLWCITLMYTKNPCILGTVKSVCVT